MLTKTVLTPTALRAEEEHMERLDCVHVWHLIVPTRWVELIGVDVRAQVGELLVTACGVQCSMMSSSSEQDIVTCYRVVYIR